MAQRAMAMLFPTLALLSILSASGSQSARELGLAAIVGYQPTHDVRDYVSGLTNYSAERRGHRLSNDALDCFMDRL